MWQHQTAKESNYQTMFFRFKYKRRKEEMQDKYKPFQFVERPQDPPEEPTIPEGIDGFYDAMNDEFVADDMALDYIGEMWDRQPDEKIEELESFLIEWMFGDWERIRGD